MYDFWKINNNNNKKTEKYKCIRLFHLLSNQDNMEQLTQGDTMDSLGAKKNEHKKTDQDQLPSGCASPIYHDDILWAT